MICKSTDPAGSGYRISDIVQTNGNIDYVANGRLHTNTPIKSVMITAETDLALLTGYEPGTIAYTAGFGSMWQLAADGTWASISSV